MNEPNLKNLIIRYEANKGFLEKHPENREFLEKQLEQIKNDILEYITSNRFKSALEYLNL